MEEFYILGGGEQEGSSNDDHLMQKSKCSKNLYLDIRCLWELQAGFHSQLSKKGEKKKKKPAAFGHRAVRQ